MGKLRQQIMNIADLKNEIAIAKFCIGLSRLAESFIFDKPEAECFTPFEELVYEGWDKYEEAHPYKIKFEKGVYMNDDSEYVGQGIVYAANHIDVSKMLPHYSELPEEAIAEFRYSLAKNYYDYMRHATPTPFVWNPATLNWRNVVNIVFEGKNYGKTLTL